MPCDVWSADDPPDSSGGKAPPDMRIFTTANGVTQFLDDCGPHGRQADLKLQVADVFYPAIVGTFMASSLSLALRRLSPRRNRVLWLGVLPLVGSAYDYIENACAWLALTSYPDAIATSHLLGVASAARTATFWAAGLLLLGALAAIAARTTKARLPVARTGTPGPSDHSDDREVIGSAR